MFVDADLAPPSKLSADVCIVGGGLAGLALAAELADRGRQVILCEGGNRHLTADSMSQYVGDCTLSNHAGDSKPHDAYLSASRLRFLGGSGNHWGGSCTFLDSCDFTERNWLEFSGWPMEKSDLTPHYLKACEMLRIRYPGDDNQDIVSPHAVYDLGFSDKLVNTFKQRSPFATQRGIYLQNKIHDVENSPGATLIANSNLVNMETSSAKDISRATFQNYKGQRFDIRARTFVLACGGIENPRLLLYLAPSLGYRNDQIGRYFMEHLVFQSAGELHLTRDRLNTALYNHPKGFEGYIELTNSIRTQEELLSVKLGLQDSQSSSPHTLDSFLDPSPRNAERQALPLRILIGEQAPNPESRVRLSQKRDTFGIPRVRLDWRTQKIDHDSLRKTVALMAQEFGAAGRGRFRFDFPPHKMLVNAAGFHHMGTTRMSTRPDAGVVNPHCRVHGMKNLYIAGSSVFPTSGSAHPTVNLMALTYRLANHLHAEALS